MSTPAKVIGIAPQFVVGDVVKTAEYYRDVLGFKLIGYILDPPVFAMVERDGIHIHFGKADGGVIKTNEQVRNISSDVIIWVPEIDAFYEEVTSKKADIIQGIVKRPYGREFVLRDCNGFKIAVCD